MPRIEFEFHYNQDILIYFSAKSRSKSFFCIRGLKNYIEPSDFVHTYLVSAFNISDFHHGWASFGPVADKNTQKGELPASENFADFFVHVLR